MKQYEKEYNRILKEMSKQINKGMIGSQKCPHQIHIEKFTLLKPIEITYSDRLIKYE